MNALVRIAPRRAELFARRRAVVRWAVPVAMLGAMTGLLLTATHRAPPSSVVHRPHHAHHGHRRTLHPSPFDRTFTTMTRAMYDSVPHWLARHPGQWCPDSVRDLMRASWAPGSDEKLSNLDAWRHPMELRCDVTPAGHTIELRSPGPDGQFDTPDDLAIAR